MPAEFPTVDLAILIISLCLKATDHQAMWLDLPSMCSLVFQSVRTIFSSLYSTSTTSRLPYDVVLLFYPFHVLILLFCSIYLFFTFFLYKSLCISLIPITSSSPPSFQPQIASYQSRLSITLYPIALSTKPVVLHRSPSFFRIIASSFVSVHCSSSTSIGRLDSAF